MTRKLLGTAAVLFFAVGFTAQGVAQQATDTSPEPPISRPAYAPGSGPVVAIDEAHQNTHTYGGALQRFVRLLHRDGFRVRPLAAMVSPEALEDIDILVIFQPGGWEGAGATLTDGEVSALLEWIRRGGSLLMVLDHMPGPAGGQRIASALGIETWHNGYAAVEAAEGPVYTIRYQRAGQQREAGLFQTFGGGLAWQGPDAVVADHAVTAGRGSDEQVQTVLTFGGSAFRAGLGPEPLLILPEHAISLAPSAPNQNPSDAGTPRVAVGGWFGGAAMRLDRGRVALFAEAGMFSAQWPVHAAAADNYKLVLNVMRWLGGALN